MKDSTTRAVAVLIVIALLLAGAGLALVGGERRRRRTGTTPSEPVEPTVEPTPDPGSTDAPSTDLSAFYAQELSWEECRDGFECARLSVPVDYADPGGASIELEVLRDSADEPSERVGSLVVNPGGPGAPGTSYAEQAGQVFRSPLTDHFDVVGFDPRGTGESAPVDCLSDEQMDAFLQADPVPDDEEEIGEVVEGLDDFWAGLRDQHRRRRGRHRLARHDDRGGPGHGRAAGRARRGAAHVLRRLLRHQARCDLRRPVPGQGRPARPRRRRRRVARLGVTEPRTGRRLRAGADGVRRRLRRRGRLLPRRHDRGGARHDRGHPRRPRRRTRCRRSTSGS